MAARHAALVLLLLLIGVSPRAAAERPFDGSTLTPIGPPPVEGQPYAYRLTLTSSRDSSGEVEILLPSAAMFAGLQGLEDVDVDHDSRTLRWRGSWTAGVPRVATLTLVAGIDAGGQTSSLRVSIRPWQGDTTYLTHVAEVDTWLPPTLFRVGRIGVTTSGLAVLGWLVAMGVFWFLVRVVRPRAANWAPIVIGVPAGFLLYFAALAWEDRRILALPETTCTVVDRVLDTRTASSTRRRGPETVYAPRLALTYDLGDRHGVAQGFGTDSRLTAPRASRAQRMLERYAIGARVPCAIDSRDTRRAYVERGFGGAYLFALIPLPLLLLGVWGLGRK